MENNIIHIRILATKKKSLTFFELNAIKLIICIIYRMERVLVIQPVVALDIQVIIHFTVISTVCPIFGQDVNRYHWYRNW